jgi:hypothetical protein
LKTGFREGSGETKSSQLFPTVERRKRRGIHSAQVSKQTIKLNAIKDMSKYTYFCVSASRIPLGSE